MCFELGLGLEGFKVRGWLLSEVYMLFCSFSAGAPSPGVLVIHAQNEQQFLNFTLGRRPYAIVHKLTEKISITYLLFLDCFEDY